MRLFYLKFLLIDPILKKPKISLLSLLDLLSGHFSYHLFVTCKLQWCKDSSRKERLQSGVLLILVWVRKPISGLVFNSCLLPRLLYYSHPSVNDWMKASERHHRSFLISLTWHLSVVTRRSLVRCFRTKLWSASEHRKMRVQPLKAIYRWW